MSHGGEGSEERAETVKSTQERMLGDYVNEDIVG